MHVRPPPPPTHTHLFKNGAGGFKCSDFLTQILNRHGVPDNKRTKIKQMHGHLIHVVLPLCRLLHNTKNSNKTTYKKLNETKTQPPKTTTTKDKQTKYRIYLALMSFLLVAAILAGKVVIAGGRTSFG